MAVLLILGKSLEFAIGRRAAGTGPTVKNSDKFKRTGALLSPAELKFYEALLRVLGPGVGVAPKVRLADLIAPARRLSRSAWQRDFNKLAMKHVDFVLFDKRNGLALGAIELDDASHLTLAAGIRDAFKDEALNSADIRIIRFRARSFYGESELRAELSGIWIPREGPEFREV